MTLNATLAEFSPMYEERLIVTKRLVLRERMRVRRVRTTDRQLFQDTLRRERLVVSDQQHTGLVREQYPVDERDVDTPDKFSAADGRTEPEGGFLEHMVRKVLE